MDEMIKIIFQKVGILYIGMIIFTTSATVIFLPIELQEKLMLQSIRDDYGKYLGMALILSGAYIGVAFIGKTVFYIRKWKDKRVQRNFILEKIENLTNDDMSVISTFYDPEIEMLGETATLNYFDRRVKLLEGYSIIIKLASSGIGTMGLDCNMSCPLPYRLNSFARNFINKEMRKEKT